jgi:hypothetical protein
MRWRAASPVWGSLGMLGAVIGAVTVLVAAWTFVEFSYFHDSGWVYAADTGTLALALTSYALLFVAIMALRRANRMSAALSSQRAT